MRHSSCFCRCHIQFHQQGYFFDLLKEDQKNIKQHLKYVNDQILNYHVFTNEFWY